jgi:ketosteroid isomerase-like protein
MPVADAATREEILAQEEGLQAALMGPDLEWFEQNWMPDAIYVHLSGGVDGTPEFIERLRSRATVYNSRQTGDVVVRQYGDTAIVTGWSKIDILVRGVKKLLDTRFTRVYVRKDGRWLLASNQSGANTAAMQTPPS